LLNSPLYDLRINHKIACKNHIISEHLDFFLPEKRILAQIRAEKRFLAQIRAFSFNL
jgi:hypothetical protein